ncbi:HSP20 family molecular chaperone IbpA [Albidovulum inexpectatum]|uniref:HSP20 family molecular chaperone IbpA n=1 Tax=Albidovulum inexpectatum TaxID=196587 RepID=A0A2S5JJC2_9RHOB|nr:Hsp20/alpha crystallin family protein [Albidovulum inexpectatum]PPB81491.1 HSP20 family molecular chaperone IbpA [Albidovulum inexpectatum]
MSTEVTRKSNGADEAVKRVYRPLTDIVETEDGVTLMVEMPGVAPDDVDVTLEKRVLTIRGRVHPVRSDKLRLAYAEYGEGDFERSFTLSEDFDPERIEAKLSNGVLTLTLPRAAETTPRKISVKAA